jgi:hypothetical protein
MRAARAVLLLDAVGCGATALAIVALPSGFAVVDASLRTRRPVAIALTGTAVVCALGARDAAPTRGDLAAAAISNAAWVAVCLAALPHQRSVMGKSLVLGTAVLDAAAGGLQWLLAARAESS